MQVPLALIGSLSALVSWWFDGGRAWLVGGLPLLLVIPFTLVVILRFQHTTSGSRAS